MKNSLVFDNFEKDILWNGLPVVFFKNKFLIFSPYAKKIICVDKKRLIDKEFKNFLEKDGFFGSVQKNVKEDRLSITLYLTSSCNLKCVYCFDDKEGCSDCIYTKDAFMKSEFAIRALGLIIKNHNKFISGKEKVKLNIHFFGGEPTLNFKVIKDVIEFLESKKIDTNYWISTNGVTTEENIKYMILKNFRFDICCDGLPRIHNKQRPTKLIGKLKSSDFIERLIKLLVKHKAKFRTKVVVTRSSTKDMPKNVEYLAKMGVDHIRLEAVLIDGRAEKGKIQSVVPKEFVKYFLLSADVAKKLSKTLNRKIYVSNWAIRNLFEPRDYFCQFVRGNRIALNPNGTIAKCVRNLHSDDSSPFVIGKINANNLKFSKNNFAELKKLSVDRMPGCANCFAKYICSGGCFNENFSASKDGKKPNKIKCLLARLMVKNLIIRMYSDFSK